MQVQTSSVLRAPRILRAGSPPDDYPLGLKDMLPAERPEPSYTRAQHLFGAHNNGISCPVLAPSA